MTKARFASQSSLLKWAGCYTTQCHQLGDVLVVPKDGLFWYFSLDDEKWYNLAMVSSTNLAEEK